MTLESLADYIARKHPDDYIEELQSLEETLTPRWIKWTRQNERGKDLTLYNGAATPAGSDGAA